MGLLNTIGNGDEDACDLRSEMAKVVDLDNVESLQVDYSRLFIGPYGLLAPPYGSMYLENMGILIGASTLDVQRRYAREGLSVDIKEVPDHIAIELEFMYYLVLKEEEANSIGDSQSAAAYQKKQKAFLVSHLGVWVADFADKVESNARTEYFRTLARVTKSFIKRDLELLSEKLSVILQ